MKAIKAIISVIKGLATIVLVAIIALIAVQRFSNNSKALLGYRLFNVVTESMVPKYNVTDVLLVKEKDVKQIQVGEDVTYLGKEESFKDKVVTHRVIATEQAEDGSINFHTKGIANEKEDPIVNESQIYGIVLRKLVIMSYLSKIMNNTYGMFFLILIPLGVIITTEIRGYKEDKESLENEYEDDEDEYDRLRKKDKKQQERYYDYDRKDIDEKARRRKEKRAKRRRKYS